MYRNETMNQYILFQKALKKITVIKVVGVFKSNLRFCTSAADKNSVLCALYFFWGGSIKINF